MRSLDVDGCLEFQNVFFDAQAGAYSPYENIQDPASYYPMAFIGEVGSALNAYGKRHRSMNNYDDVIADEAVDIFLYLMMGPRVVRPNEPEILDGMRDDWNEPPDPIANDAQLTMTAGRLISGAVDLIPHDTARYTTEHFREMFGLAKSMGVYMTGQDWQKLIDDAHVKYADIRTIPEQYTPDLRTKGAGYQNFGLLLDWVNRYEIPLPKKRLDFLARMMLLQSVLAT